MCPGEGAMLKMFICIPASTFVMAPCIHDPPVSNTAVHFYSHLVICSPRFRKLKILINLTVYLLIYFVLCDSITIEYFGMSATIQYCQKKYLFGLTNTKSFN